MTNYNANILIIVLQNQIFFHEIVLHNAQKLALQNKQLKEIEKWQNEKIFDTYININNDFGDCEFFSNWLKN